MGYMTVVVVSNDYLSEIENQPLRLVRELGTALRTGEGAELNGVHILPSQHGDNTQLVAVGGGCSTPLHTVHGNARHNTHEDQVELLRKWADHLGFDVVERGSK